MCQLYEITMRRWELVAYFNATDGSRREVDIEKDYVSPGRDGYVVTSADGTRRVETMRWGWPPPAGAKRPVVNVRNYASPF